MWWRRDNIFLRSCIYDGNKDNWKEVIIEQIKQHLRDIEVEEGFVKSETRYLSVENEKHLEKEKFETRERDLIQKFFVKNSEGKQ